MKKQAVITAAIARAIQNTPSGSTAGQNGEAKVIAELRFPKGKGSFLIFEGTHQRGEKWDGDSVFAWKSELGSTYEIERVSLKELQERRVEMSCSFGTYEAKIERNAAVDVKKRTLADVMGVFAPAAFKPSAAWAATDATAERDELMELVSDYLFLASGNADADICDALERDGLDYRGQLDVELSERVRRVYGPEKWEQIAACF